MRDSSPRLTHQSLKVLKLFSDNPTTPLAGADIARAADVASGTLYPILIRFERCNILKSKWEHASAQSLGRPRRRWYSLTAHGRKLATDSLTFFNT
jgi:DNA-binding PadR family transcriptional regulator